MFFDPNMAVGAELPAKHKPGMASTSAPEAATKLMPPPSRACCGWMGLWEFINLWGVVVFAWDALVLLSVMFHAAGRRVLVVPPFWTLPEGSNELIQNSEGLIVFDW